MSEGKHTPGPWRFGAYVIVGADNTTVVDCQFGNPMQVADARLIAAAPDLLEALKEVVSLSDRKHDAWNRARAVIAKAEGREGE